MNVIMFYWLGLHLVLIFDESKVSESRTLSFLFFFFFVPFWLFEFCKETLLP